jgi:hypothetical protein
MDGNDPWMEAGDWLALGRLLMRTGRRADGWRALRNAAAMAQGQASAAAALLLARRLVRHRRPRAAEAFLAEIHSRQPADPAVAVARARVLEWQLRDPAAALTVVDAALRHPLPPGLGVDLEHRRERLQRRVTSVDGGRSGRDGRGRRGARPALDRGRQWRQGLLLDD